MAGERAEVLPEDLREWVNSKATDLETAPEAVLARAVSAYRLVDENADRLSSLQGDDAGELAARTDALDGRISALEADVDEKIEDVRARVVQIKRESDAKAPADHDHPTVETRVGEVDAEVDDLRGSIEDVRRRLDAGFENYETVLDYLTDAADELDEKVDTLARTLLDLRSRTDRLETDLAERAAAEELRTEANRQGTRDANCVDCGESVDVALLSRPKCPHCGATFTDVEPARGFFGSAKLVVGERPALEGTDTDTGTAAPADLFEENR